MKQLGYSAHLSRRVRNVCKNFVCRLPACRLHNGTAPHRAGRGATDTRRRLVLSRQLFMGRHRL